MFIITLSPNPCNDVLYLTISDAFKNGGVMLFSEKGQCVKTMKTASLNEIIDISTLSNGIYFLQNSHDQYFSIKKIIKQN